MELQSFMERADRLDEALDRFILNLPENFDEDFYNSVIEEMNELEDDVNKSSLDTASKLVVIGTISAMMEYAVALIQTF